MSASYWESTQRTSWRRSPAEVADARARLLSIDRQLSTRGIPLLKSDTHLRIYLHNCIHKLGVRMSLRQQVMATAEVYLMRFLLGVSVNEINLYMLVAAVLYLASKTEECPLHIRSVLMEARNCWPEFVPNDFTKLAELEFYVMEELECQVVIHHPYRALKQLAPAMGIVDMGPAWGVLNDMYATDAMLHFPPHVIALAAVCLAVCGGEARGGDCPGDLADFLARGEIQVEEVAEVCAMVLALHKAWGGYDENEVRARVRGVLGEINRLGS